MAPGCPHRPTLNDIPQGLTGTEYFEKECSECIFHVSQGLWQWGQLVGSLQYNISKRYANASWNLNVTLDLFHTMSPQLNWQSGSSQRDDLCVDLEPHQPQPSCEPRQQGTVLSLLLTICICHYSSSCTWYSTASGTGTGAAPWDGQRGWPFLWAKPCKRKTATPNAASPTKVLRLHHPQFKPVNSTGCAEGRAVSTKMH